MNQRKTKLISKLLSASLGLTLVFGASAAALPVVMDSVSITANAAASVNATDVTIYGMDSWTEDFDISIPSSFKTKYQLKVTGASKVTYSSSNSNIVKVSSTGLIEPNVTTWYWYGRIGYSYELSGSEPTQITRSYNFGEATVTVTADGVKYPVKVTVADYADYYCNQVMDKYIKDNDLLNKNKSTEEKLDKIAKFVADRNYDWHYQSYQAMIIAGGGDCWASTNTVNALARKIGLRAWIRNGNRDFGAGSGHRNSIVTDGKKYYEVEAGYNQTAPRYYSIKERKSLFSVRNNSTYDGIEVYQYDGETMPEVLTVPDTIEGKKVVSIGNSFVSMESDIKEVKLPDTVKYIGVNAFYGCTSLAKINIPKALTKVDERAFGECYNLSKINTTGSGFTYSGGILYQGTKVVSFLTGTSANIKSGSTEIQAGAFAYNKKIESVVIPSSMETLGEGSFAQCFNLSSVTIKSKKIKSIPAYAFAYTNVKCFEIPESVTDIDSNAFINYDSKMAETIIVCKSGSAAEKYAQNNGCTFLETSKLLNNTSSVSSANVASGDTVSVTASYKGGKAPYKTEVYVRYQTDSKFSDNLLKDGATKASFKAAKTGCYVVKTVVTDGYGITKEKTINVSVSDRIQVTAAASAKTVNTGKSVTITASASRGFGNYTYALQLKQTDGTWKQVVDFSSNNKIAYKLTKAGQYKLRVVAKDAKGYKAYATVTVTAETPLVNRSTISSTKTFINRAVLIVGDAENIKGGCQFGLEYVVTGENSKWTTVYELGSSTHMVFNPVRPGNYILRVTAKDYSGRIAYKSFSLSVSNQLKNTSSVSKTSVAAGKNVTVYTSASGGFGGYKYEVLYKLDGDKKWTKLSEYSNTTSVVFKPAKAGKYTISVNVRDSAEFKSNVKFTVNAY